MFNQMSESLNSKVIIKQLKRYRILNQFTSEEELNQWMSKRNHLEIHNLLTLDIEPESIKFDTKLLINTILLNTLDYSKRVKSLVSIKNAAGCYHLFDHMLTPEFLNSGKFYYDIETLKKAKSAQAPLRIIGDPTFIHSPYHDEDLKLLVTAKDTSDEKLDFVIWDAIAAIAKNYDSIYGGHHRQDLQTIIKYGSPALQLSNTYPEESINNLAMNPVSIEDPFHLENMEILAQNFEIGNFLYAVMTNSNAIKGKNYRDVIKKMVEKKDDIDYVFLICCNILGEQAAINAITTQNLLSHSRFYEIQSTFYTSELLQTDQKSNIAEKRMIISKNIKY